MGDVLAMLGALFAAFGLIAWIAGLWAGLRAWERGLVRADAIQQHAEERATRFLTTAARVGARLSRSQVRTGIAEDGLPKERELRAAVV